MFPTLRPALPGLAAMTMLLAACGQPSPYTVSAQQCDPAQHQALIGRNIGEIFLPPNLPRREIGPGQMVMQSFNPARLNIYMDAKGWVGRITCG